MDIKLQDVMSVIKTFQVVQIKDEDYGESFYPSYGEIQEYSDYYVTDIQTDNNASISISISR